MVKKKRDSRKKKTRGVASRDEQRSGTRNRRDKEQSSSRGDAKLGGTRSRARQDEKQRSSRRAPATNEGKSPSVAQVSSGDDHEPSPLIVGIGASAGGLEAISQLLKDVPVGVGLSVIIVQHLALNQDRVLAHIFADHSKMNIVQAETGTEVLPDHVYVLPPHTLMELRNGRLYSADQSSNDGRVPPIDFMFRSLARYAGERAIGVVLSGMASDGVAGLREIKLAGGITLAQDPASARFQDMPRAAIDSGIVDLVMNPHELGTELGRLAMQAGSISRVQPEPELSGSGIEEVLEILGKATGIDFKHYKTPTIRRRLQRRMVLHRIESFDQYVKLLRENPREVANLFRDVLIHVTSFFREPESFRAMSEIVFPRIVAGRQDMAPIRVWIPGCSTGEEAYSLAIALLEFLSANKLSYPIQVFATDVSEAAVVRARAGVYPASIASQVPAERLERFFTKLENGYRINQFVRDLCVFARQDITRDPPFSRLDLILCRNVLIYLGATLQKRLMSIFHYALRSSGFLILGHAETTGSADLFALADKKHKIYAKKVSDIPHVDLEFSIETRRGSLGNTNAPAMPQTAPLEGAVVHKANRLVLERYGPPGVIVDSDYVVLQTRGSTGVFLELPSGNATLNVLKMARQGLGFGLRSALNEARHSESPIRRDGLRVKHNGTVHHVSIEAIPILVSGANPHFLILFHDVTPGNHEIAPLPEEALPETPELRRITDLQQEIEANRQHMQSMIQDLEAANEELQSANEEILSSNEELQSTNEELDTAREELQSTNEEVNTINEELHARNEELVRVNSDLGNLLASVRIAIVIVSQNLEIRRFTPMAEKVLNLIETDVGRSIGHIKPNIDCPELENLITEVIETVAPIERKVRDSGGSIYSLRIRPYKDADNRIDGAVLGLFEIQNHTASDIDHMIGLLSDPIALLDPKGKILASNPAFSAHLDLRQQDLAGQSIYELDGRRWDEPRLRELLEVLLMRDPIVERHDVEYRFDDGTRTLRLAAAASESFGTWLTLRAD